MDEESIPRVLGQLQRRVERETHLNCYKGYKNGQEKNSLRFRTSYRLELEKPDRRRNSTTFLI